MLPEVEAPLVKVRFPLTVDAAIFSMVVPLSMVAWPEDPEVLSVTTPVSALVAVFNVMVASSALVVKEEVPVT